MLIELALVLGNNQFVLKIYCMYWTINDYYYDSLDIISIHTSAAPPIANPKMASPELVKGRGHFIQLYYLHISPQLVDLDPEWWELSSPESMVHVYKKMSGTASMNVSAMHCIARPYTLSNWNAYTSQDPLYAMPSFAHGGYRH